LPGFRSSILPGTVPRRWSREERLNGQLKISSSPTSTTPGSCFWPTAARCIPLHRGPCRAMTRVPPVNLMAVSSQPPRICRRESASARATCRRNDLQRTWGRAPGARGPQPPTSEGDDECVALRLQVITHATAKKGPEETRASGCRCRIARFHHTQEKSMMPKGVEHVSTTTVARLAISGGDG
jgi:hypothetical protein